MAWLGSTIEEGRGEPRQTSLGAVPGNPQIHRQGEETWWLGKLWFACLCGTLFYVGGDATRLALKRVVISSEA